MELAPIMNRNYKDNYIDLSDAIESNALSQKLS